MSATYLDCFMIFSCLLWVIFCRLRTWKIMPLVSWAFDTARNKHLETTRVKTAVFCIFSLSILLAISIRFYGLLSGSGIDLFVCIFLPTSFFLYSAFTVGLYHLFMPLHARYHHAYLREGGSR